MHWSALVHFYDSCADVSTTYGWNSGKQIDGGTNTRREGLISSMSRFWHHRRSSLSYSNGTLVATFDSNS